MAELNNAAIIGNFLVRPTGYAADEQLWFLRNYDRALGNCGHDRMHYAPASFFTLDLHILTPVPDGGTGSSVKLAAPWPFTIWAADLGAESCAGASGVIDIRVDPVGAGADASILDAAQDVKTGVGVGQRVAPEVGLGDVGYGDLFYIKGTSGAGGTIVGGQAHLYCQRL